MRADRAINTNEQSAAVVATPDEEVAVLRNHDNKRKNKSGDRTADDDVSFWDFVAGLGDKWLGGDLKTYVYRVWPRIDKQQDKVYLSIIQEKFDEEFLLRTYGSGRYLLMVKDRSKMLRKHTVSVHNPAYPPRVDDSEVVSDPVNDAYFRTWAKNSNAGDALGKKEPAKGETAEILNTVFERTSKVDPTLVDLWKDTAQQRDELAKLLSERKTETAPQPAAQPDLLSILTQVKALQADPLAMLEKMRAFFPAREPDRTKEALPQRNSLDELKNMLEVFGAARDLFKPEPAAAAVAGPGPDADMWERIAVNISSQVAPTVNAIAGLVMAFKGQAVQPIAGAASVMPPPPVSFDPYRDQARMRDFVRSQQNPNPPGPVPQPVPGAAPPTTAAAAPDTTAAAPDPMAAQVINLMVQALSCLNRNVDGHQAAEAVIDLQGQLTYQTLVEQIKTASIPVVIELAKGIPEIGQQVLIYEQPLRNFIEEFIEEPEFEDEGQPAAG